MLWRNIVTGILLFAALPSTSTYKLDGYGFGSGGTAGSSTSNYALEGSSGEISGQTSSTATYKIKPAFTETIQANVPIIATFDNGSSTYYNKLHFVIGQENNPTDATYALSISTDNFSSDIRYVKSDLTVGASLALADYQTYAAWGGASGSNVIGLLPNTTYYLRAKATQGKFTESGYGPVSSATTVSPQLSFSISTTSIDMGTLTTNTVVDAPSAITVSFATNANSGGDIYISGLNIGLKSLSKTNTITSTTGDLSVLTHGFGAQVTSTSASSGALSAVSPYNGSSNNVGLTDTTIRKIISASSPVVGGSGSIMLKAKSALSDGAASDYSEVLTLIASGTF